MRAHTHINTQTLSLTCMNLCDAALHAAAGPVRRVDGHIVGLAALQFLQITRGGAAVAGGHVPTGCLAHHQVQRGTAALLPAHRGCALVTVNAGLNGPRGARG